MYDPECKERLPDWTLAWATLSFDLIALLMRYVTDSIHTAHCTAGSHLRHVLSSSCCVNRSDASFIVSSRQWRDTVRRWRPPGRCSCTRPRRPGSQCRAWVMDSALAQAGVGKWSVEEHSWYLFVAGVTARLHAAGERAPSTLPRLPPLSHSESTPALGVRRQISAAAWPPRCGPAGFSWRWACCHASIVCFHLHVNPGWSHRYFVHFLCIFLTLWPRLQSLYFSCAAQSSWDSCAASACFKRFAYFRFYGVLIAIGKLMFAEWACSLKLMGYCIPFSRASKHHICSLQHGASSSKNNRTMKQTMFTY